MHNPPAVRHRLIVACLVALVFGTFTYSLLVSHRNTTQARDFTYPWLAARALMSGVEPYRAVQSAQTPWGSGFFYPLPAAVVVSPFTVLPLREAAAIFVAIGTGLLAFMVTRVGMWRLVLFLSAPALVVCFSVQWSPLLTAASLAPAALGLVVVKPNLALPLLAFQGRTRALLYAIAGAAALIAISTVLSPRWPIHWLAVLRQDPAMSQYSIPLLHPLGVIVALAALKWRRPEARLLLCMACTPQNGFFYDQLPLLLVPQSKREMYAAALASHVAYYLRGDFPISSATFHAFMIIGLYWPALYFVLRRTNEAGPA